MRILEERKDYTLRYDVYLANFTNYSVKNFKCETKKIIEISLGTEDYYDIQFIVLKDFDKDIKKLSNKLIKKWKRETRNALR